MARCNYIPFLETEAEWFTRVRMEIVKSLQIITDGEVVEKMEPSYTVGGNATLRNYIRGTRWWRSGWMWNTSLSMDTSGIYLQTQKSLQNTS